MATRTEFKISALVFILLLFTLSLFFFILNCYHLFINDRGAINLFRKLGYSTGSLLTTLSFALLALAILIFEVRKKLTSLIMTDDYIIYKKVFSKKRKIHYSDIHSLESIYEITKAAIFPNELLIVQLKTDKVIVSKMYSKNFVQIKKILQEKYKIQTLNSL